MKKTLKQQPHKPCMKWQTGEYERRASFRFVLPYQFLLLCKMLDITPEQVTWDFINTLDCRVGERSHKDVAREYLINYFIECGYGQDYYTIDDIKQMFLEMDAVNLLFPENSGEKELLKRYSKWRDKHQSWWFKKWYFKVRRKPGTVNQTEWQSKNL